MIRHRLGCSTAHTVRTVLTAVPVDHTTQWTVPDPVAAMRLQGAVLEVPRADVRHVARPDPLDHMVLQVQRDPMVRQVHTAQRNLSVQQVLTDHLKRQRVDHLAVLQAAERRVVLHGLLVVLMAPLAQLLPSVQPVLTDLIRQVGLTAGNFCCGVANDTVK